MTAPAVRNEPPPWSATSFPSMNEAAESRKKLQCARWRPSSRSEEAPVASRKRRVASQRWPLSWPRRASVVFSPTFGTRAVGSDGYFARSSMTRTLDSSPALPYSREKS